MESLGMIVLWLNLVFQIALFLKNLQMVSNFARKMLFHGDSIFPYLDLDDEIIELSITPNRADALSMRGVALRSCCNLW